MPYSVDFGVPSLTIFLRTHSTVLPMPFQISPRLLGGRLFRVATRFLQPKKSSSCARTTVQIVNTSFKVRGQQTPLSACLTAYVFLSLVDLPVELTVFTLSVAQCRLHVWLGITFFSLTCLLAPVRRESMNWRSTLTFRPLRRRSTCWLTYFGSR